MFYKNKKQRLLAFILLPLVPLAFMLLTPWGSINPSTINFWIALIGGVSTSLLTDYLLSRYQSDKTHNNKDK